MQGSLHYIGLLILMLDMHMYKGMTILLSLVLLLLFISFSLLSSAFKHSLNKLFPFSAKLIMKQKYSSTGSELWKGTILFLT
jgi:membrane glycosyltransferase